MTGAAKAAPPPASSRTGFLAAVGHQNRSVIGQLRRSLTVKVNKKRWEIEECFRIMKTDFEARPVYVKRQDRILAHFITCFIAMIIYRYLEKELSKSGKQYTIDRILDTQGRWTS